MHREKLAVHFMLFITFHSLKVNFIRQIYLTNFIVIRAANYLLASSMATATATCHMSNRSGNSTMGLLPAPDNRRRASLQARLQASLRRLLHER